MISHSREPFLDWLQRCFASTPGAPAVVRELLPSRCWSDLAVLGAETSALLPARSTRIASTCAASRTATMAVTAAFVDFISDAFRAPKLKQLFELPGTPLP